MVAHHPLFHRFKALIATLGVGLGLVISALPAVAQTRILFVGNSFTHGYTAPAQNYNAAAIIDENYGQLPSSPRYEGDGAGPWGGVPGIFKKLTDEAGLNYEVHIEAINGVTLQYHYENALSVIQQVGGWDRVVLQELSTRPLPTNRSGNPSLFFDYSTRLEQAVHSVNAAAKVYLYETWARADLTYPSGQPYSGQPIETMGNDLHAGYYQALAQNTGLEAVAPVGDAWLRAIQAGVALRNPYNPTAGKFDLWSGYFHASEWGSYLSANVLFFQITGVDPRTLGAAEQAAADMGISQTQAVALQQIAYEQVSGTTPPAQYSLTVTTSGSGTVSKNPAQGPYASGSNVVLTATPGAGYQFGSWGGDASGSTNPLTVNMTSNKTITATFAAIPTQQVTSFTLVNATTNADIQTLAAGATLNLATLPTRNLNIRANTNPATVGSVVFNLSGAATQNQTDSAFPYALFLDNGGVYNSWTPPVGSYTLLATPYTTGGGTGQTFYRGINVNGGAITLDGQSWVGSSGAANLQLSGTAFANQGVALSPATDATRAGMIRSSIYGRAVTAALPNTPAGTYAVYLYVWEDNYAQSFSVTLEGQPVLANYTSGAAGHWDRLGPFMAAVTDGTLNIATAGGDANLSGIEVWKQNTATGVAGTSLSINFSVIDQAPPTQYSLTVTTSGSGSVAKNPAQGPYNSGSSVVLTATPGAGYQFSGWGGDATGSTNPLTVAMTSDKTITAAFVAAPVTYSLTVSTSGSGTVSKNPAQGPYASGSNVVLTATPGAGYQFGSWGGDASGSTNPLTVNMTSSKTITATFTPTSAGQTFYRGINVNGGAITLDGQSWVGSSGAANLQLSGTAFANQGVALSPATDATRAGMIRSSIYGRTVTAALPNTPAGTYAVYLYVWEDNYAQSFGVTLEGQPVLANYTSGAAGHWDRLGPFMAAVTDGTLNIATAGGDANLSGIEVWKQNTVNRTILTPYLTNTTQANGSAEGATTSQALTGALSASRVAHAPAQAYPNPSGDGRFQVLLPEEFQGEISYTLLSALGARLATGHLTTAPLAPALAFDFSHEMTSTGLYHLQLQSQGKQAAIRLIRP